MQQHEMKIRYIQLTKKRGVDVGGYGNWSVGKFNKWEQYWDIPTTKWKPDRKKKKKHRQTDRERERMRWNAIGLGLCKVEYNKRKGS